MTDFGSEPFPKGEEGGQKGVVPPVRDLSPVRGHPGVRERSDEGEEEETVVSE